MAVRVAIEGCGHGTLHAIYEAVEKGCTAKGWNGVDLLIIGGDFQSVRNSHDLNAMAVPVKYREIGDFHEYYSGARTAPYLTIFVGGNHEASNYLFELYYGGWVAPNIYYMGAANVIRCGPLRIAGLSGIWKGYNYQKPHFERIPYNEDDVRSIYHVREVDVRKLMQIRTQVDAGISHDWPRGVEWAGNWKALFAMKRHFEEDARNGTLGSVAARHVMDRLRPYHWFSAHLHCKFTATIHHDSGGAISHSSGHIGAGKDDGQLHVSNPGEIDIHMDGGLDLGNDSKLQAVPSNEDEIDLDVDESEDLRGSSAKGKEPIIQRSAETEESMLRTQAVVSEDLRNQLPDSFKSPKRKRSPTPQPFPTGITNATTEFLALDKCLPNRKFLEFREISHQGYLDSSSQRPYKLEYDDEWLAITRVFAAEQKFGDHAARTTENKGEGYYRPLIEAELQWIHENLSNHGAMLVPENFEQTAPVYDSQISINTHEVPKEYTNNQTEVYCKMLNIPNPFNISEEERQKRMTNGPAPAARGRGGGGGRGWGRGGGRGRGGQGRGRGRW